MIKKEISVILTCDCPDCTNLSDRGPVIERFFGRNYEDCIKQAAKVWIFWKCKNGVTKTFSKDCLDIGDE